MTDLTIGDVVQLKSGGPLMTIEYIYKENGSTEKDAYLRSMNAEDGRVYVTYFNDKNELQNQEFSPTSLVIYS